MTRNNEKRKRVKLDELNRSYNAYRSNIEGSKEGWICKDCFIKLVFNDPLIWGSLLFCFLIFSIGVTAVKSAGEFLLLLVTPPMVASLLLWQLGYFATNRYYLQSFVDKQGIRLIKGFEKDHKTWTQREYLDLQKANDK